MKRKILLSLLVVLVIATSVSFGAYAASKVTLVVNGKTSATDPILIKGVTYVPVRAAAEMFGAKVGYDASTNTVTLTTEQSAAEKPATTTSQLKSYDVDVTVNSGPMVFKISKVTLDPAYKQYSFEQEPHAAIILDVSAENTTDQSLSWYVNQFQLVLNTKEQIERALLNDDYVTPDFNGKVVKNGKIAYEVEDSNLDDISSIRVLIGSVTDDEFNTVSPETETAIILK